MTPMNHMIQLSISRPYLGVEQQHTSRVFTALNNLLCGVTHHTLQTTIEAEAVFVFQFHLKQTGPDDKKSGALRGVGIETSHAV